MDFLVGIFSYTLSDELLGMGRNSLVYQGTFQRTMVAIKKIEISRITKHVDIEKCQSESLQLNHPNIVQLFAIKQNHIYKFFIMEQCVGSLYDFYRGRYKGIVPSAIHGLCDMSNGLAYIHSKSMAHCNLKTTNVLISLPDVEGAVHLKLSDYGFNKFTSNTTSIHNIGVGNTKAFLAPEILKVFNDGVKDSRESETLLKSADVFSLGCLFYSYLTKGDHPFGISFAIPHNIMNGNYDIECKFYF